MKLKPLALVLELIALVLLVSAFIPAQVHWELLVGGGVLVAVAILMRTLHGNQ